jgi:hypothetical protein
MQDRSFQHRFLYMMVTTVVDALERAFYATFGSGRALSDEEGKRFFELEAELMKADFGQGFAFAYNSKGLCFEQEAFCHQHLGGSLYQAFLDGNNNPIISSQDVPAVLFGLTKALAFPGRDAVVENISIQDLEGLVQNVPVDVHIRAVKTSSKDARGGKWYLMGIFCPRGGMEDWDRRRESAKHFGSMRSTLTAP